MAGHRRCRTVALDRPQRGRAHPDHPARRYPDPAHLGQQRKFPADRRQRTQRAAGTGPRGRERNRVPALSGRCQRHRPDPGPGAPAVAEGSRGDRALGPGRTCDDRRAAEFSRTGRRRAHPGHLSDARPQLYRAQPAVGRRRRRFGPGQPADPAGARQFDLRHLGRKPARPARLRHPAARRRPGLRRGGYPLFPVLRRHRIRGPAPVHPRPGVGDGRGVDHGRRQRQQGRCQGAVDPARIPGLGGGAGDARPAQHPRGVLDRPDQP